MSARRGQIWDAERSAATVSLEVKLEVVPGRVVKEETNLAKTGLLAY